MKTKAATAIGWLLGMAFYTAMIWSFFYAYRIMSANTDSLLYRAIGCILVGGGIWFAVQIVMSVVALFIFGLGFGGCLILERFGKRPRKITP